MGLKGCTWNNRVKICLLPCNHFQLLCFDLFNPFLGMKIELMLAVNVEHITFLVFKNKITVKIYVAVFQYKIPNFRFLFSYKSF